MTSNGHKKHTKLIKPAGGKFHSNEIGLIGAPCNIIQKLASDINHSLSNLAIAYIDADHGKGKHQPEFSTIYTDKIGFHQIEFYNEKVDYDLRSSFDNAAMVFINGNHFTADQQIVIINEKKEDSLSRKLDRLTNVKAFILDEGMDQPFDFLYEHQPNWKNLPIFKITDINPLSSWVDTWYQSQIPTLNGLILAGGKSTRMGTDKSLIDYHGKPHALYLADLISSHCDSVYLSKAADEQPVTGYEVIGDRFIDLGPYGGILSAFRHDPNRAWLTIATDVPLLDQKTLQFLVNERDPSKYATCFHNPETNFPEPLITIWEPRMYARMLHFLSMGYSCPRKALINSDIKEIRIQDSVVLSNANTPEEKATILAKIARD